MKNKKDYSIVLLLIILLFAVLSSCQKNDMKAIEIPFKYAGYECNDTNYINGQILYPDYVHLDTLVVIELPIAIKLPKNFKGEYVHRITVQNSVWNGMNLKQLRNRLHPVMPNWFDSHRTVNENGRYSLSLKGKQYLKKKKEKKQGINTTK